MSNNQQLTIYHDDLQVILHDEELNKMVLWDSTNRNIVVRDTPTSQTPPVAGLHAVDDHTVLHHQLSLASVTNTGIVNSGQHKTACPYCHRAFDGATVGKGQIPSFPHGNDNSKPVSVEDGYMSRDYFLLLESSSSDIPSSIPSKSNDPFSSEFLNSGYYKKFFQETKKIGSGGFGAVYHCRHLINTVDLGEFAVKKVPVGENLPWLYRVLQEVKALETLQKHKNIINYKHSWLEYDQPANFGPKIPCLFILMEYANSGNLQDYMFEKQIIPENEIWSFFIDLCHGIGYLHHSEIIHRDLKPQNILLHQYYDPVCDNQVTHLMISDFGTCDTVSGFKERLKRTGNTGTVEYAAPELFEKNVSGDYLTSGTDKCDIWSLGILLYEMTYGRLPYKNSGNPFIDDDPSRNVDLLSDEIESFTDSKFHIPSNPPRSKELKETILALLRRNPHDRPSINQILLTPFVQMKTKHMSINPINIIKESPSIRKATIRKRNLKKSKSKDVIVEQLDNYDTDENSSNGSSTTTVSTTTLSTTSFTHSHAQSSAIEKIPSPATSPTLTRKTTVSNSPPSNSIVLMKKNATVINDTTQQTTMSLSNIVTTQSPRQLQLPPSPTHGNAPAKIHSSSNKISLHHIIHLLLLLFQVWICFDQCLPMGIPKDMLLYPTLLLSSIILLASKNNKIMLGILYTLRFLWFIAASSSIDRSCQVLHLAKQMPSNKTNIIYSTLIYVVSLITIFN